MASLNSISKPKNPLEQSDPISPPRPVGSLGPLARASLGLGSVPFRCDTRIVTGELRFGV
uniref:Uncharacterized protein n=1 Tax=Oryza punctata TaxID=4537 RepID=A0A0E0LJH9_ORYPU